ncbi:hypothetical protein L209DRAFT_739681 [Thermothelomyces heterothallicus CBS 203.75]
MPQREMHSEEEYFEGATGADLSSNSVDLRPNLWGVRQRFVNSSACDGPSPAWHHYRMGMVGESPQNGGQVASHRCPRASPQQVETAIGRGRSCSRIVQPSMRRKRDE